MTQKRIDLSEEVRILELEVQKLELENRITELKAEPTNEELKDTTNKQNQILLHINAELEAIKQHNPFDLVFITGSIENISNVIKGRTEPIIDEGCVESCKVCARSCKVVDIAAKLQEELDACHLVIKNFKDIETRETDRLHKTILDMDVTILDLVDNDRRINRFLDEYRVTVDNRDKTIDVLSAMVEAKTKANQTIIHDKNTIIEELKDRNAEDLHELNELDKAERNKLASTIKDLNLELTKKRAIIDEITRLRVNEVEKTESLEAELSTRKEDSAVLMEVVEIIRDDTIPNSKVPCMICNLVDAYLDAPEVPENTPIDENQDIKVTFAFLELP